MDHSPGFLKLVNEAKRHITELSVAEARARLAQSPQVILMDVREDHEWRAGHAAEAVHLGKGILEEFLSVIWKTNFPIPTRRSLCIAAAVFVPHSRPTPPRRWVTEKFIRSSADIRRWSRPVGR
jgi:rhodanese-related sulfurtransferase